MTDQALDQLAQQILLDAACEEYGVLMGERFEHEFSPSFEKRMKKLLVKASEMSEELSRAAGRRRGP